MKRRLFVAIDFPQATKKLLAAISGKLARQHPEGRWERGDNFHLTLKFLGNTDIAPETIQAALYKKLAQTDEFTLVFGNLGIFSRRHSGIVWMEIIASEALLSLYHKINNCLAKWFVRDKHPFYPHVTLGRLKIYQEMKVSQLSARQVPLPIQVQQITVFSSHLNPKGAIHQVQAQIPLLPKSCQSEYNKVSVKS